MATEKVYERPFKRDKQKLNPQTVVGGKLNHFTKTCLKCGSTKLKIIFKAETSKIHSFLHCEDCQTREPIA